jgi:hypothetical protein
LAQVAAPVPVQGEYVVLLFDNEVHNDIRFPKKKKDNRQPHLLMRAM